MDVPNKFIPTILRFLVMLPKNRLYVSKYIYSYRIISVILIFYIALFKLKYIEYVKEVLPVDFIKTYDVIIKNVVSFSLPNYVLLVLVVIFALICLYLYFTGCFGNDEKYTKYVCKNFHNNLQQDLKFNCISKMLNSCIENKADSEMDSSIKSVFNQIEWKNLKDIETKYIIDRIFVFVNDNCIKYEAVCKKVINPNLKSLILNRDLSANIRHYILGQVFYYALMENLKETNFYDDIMSFYISVYNQCGSDFQLDIQAENHLICYVNNEEKVKIIDSKKIGPNADHCPKLLEFVGKVCQCRNERGVSSRVNVKESTPDEAPIFEGRA